MDLYGYNSKGDVIKISSGTGVGYGLMFPIYRLYPADPPCHLLIEDTLFRDKSLSLVNYGFNSSILWKIFQDDNNHFGINNRWELIYKE